MTGSTTEVAPSSIVRLSGTEDRARDRPRLCSDPLVVRAVSAPSLPAHVLSSPQFTSRAMAFVSGLSVAPGLTNIRSPVCSQTRSNFATGYAAAGHSATLVHSRRVASATVTMAAMERSFIAAKPDAVNRGLVGAIISKFEAKGYKLVGLKAIVPPRELAETHYDALRSKPFFGGLVDFMCSGPVVCMCWEGKGVVATGRRLIGETNPLNSDPSTIRGMYGIDVGRNIVHGSDAVETAEREIALWFKPEELCSWESASINNWVYE
jgi:nucleoside-diphosphate kinase